MRQPEVEELRAVDGLCSCLQHGFTQAKYIASYECALCKCRQKTDLEKIETATKTQTGIEKLTESESEAKTAMDC